MAANGDPEIDIAAIFIFGLVDSCRGTDTVKEIQRSCYSEWDIIRL